MRDSLNGATPSWLTARPIAHRGLHDPATGVIENTPSAAFAAIEGGYGIETDVQLSADGEAMVFHDDDLERLTEAAGPLASRTEADLKSIGFRGTSDRMVTLGEYCDLIAGRTPLIVEIKSRFDGDTRLAQRVADILRGYAGPAAVMSFDPLPIRTIRNIASELPRGIVAERHYNDPDWSFLTSAQKFELAWMTHALRSQPQFIAYCVDDLPALAPGLARLIFGLPVLTWTVRTDSQRALAARFADQMIFEGFRP